MSAPTGIDISVTWRYLPLHATLRYSALSQVACSRSNDWGCGPISLMFTRGSLRCLWTICSCSNATTVVQSGFHRANHDACSRRSHLQIFFRLHSQPGVLFAIEIAVTIEGEKMSSYVGIAVR